MKGKMPKKMMMSMPMQEAKKGKIKKGKKSKKAYK